MVEYIAAGNAYGSAIIGYPGNYKGIDPESLLAKLDEMLTCDPVNVNAYNVDVQEYLDEFYVNGLITAEEVREEEDTGQDVYVADGVTLPGFQAAPPQGTKKFPAITWRPGTFSGYPLLLQINLRALLHLLGTFFGGDQVVVVVGCLALGQR